MFGFTYLKSAPTTYVILYKAGKVVREGAGLSFLYFAPTSTIVQVPLASTDVPFVFTEVTSDFQEVTIQGQLTYRTTDAKRLAALLDLSVDWRGRYQSDDLSKLNDRMIQAAQIIARSFTQKRALAQVLVSSNELIAEMTAGLQSAEAVSMLGLEVIGLAISSLKPTPEMSKALQADAREELLRKADQAMFTRRNAAVEMERSIKENELNTEIAVEQKRRQVRETQMNAEIAVEQQREALVAKRVENQKKEAEAKAFALKAMLDPMKEVDWRTLMAAGGGAADPRVMIALAFRDLADNAGKIGNLNITPDLLSTLMGESNGENEPAQQSHTPKKR